MKDLQALLSLLLGDPQAFATTAGPSAMITLRSVAEGAMTLTHFTPCFAPGIGWRWVQVVLPG